MRFMLLSFLLLSLFLCFSAVSVRGQYAGVFLDPASKIIAANLQQNSTWNVSPYDVLNNFPDDSYKRTQAHHLTIEFQPNPVTKYQQFYQDIHHIKVLAYAHDNKGQAVLVELEDNPCKTQGGIEIMNAWPHVTLTDSTKAPYTAVYSNDLIDRLIAANVIQVKKIDSYGKPTKVKLGQPAMRGSDEWWGSIPAFNSTTSTAQAARPYAAGVAYVKIFPQQGRNVVRLTGTVCINTAWSDASVSCTAPKVQA